MSTPRQSAYRLLRMPGKSPGQRLRRNVAAAGLAFAGVLVLAAVSFAFTTEAMHQICLVWLPDGFVVALMLFALRARWPAIVAGHLAGEVAISAFMIQAGAFEGSLAKAVLTALFFALIGVAQALTLTVLSLRIVPKVIRWRERPLSGLRYLVLALVVPIPFALLATYCAYGLNLQDSLLVPWQIWWMGDALGFLLVVPFFLVFALPIHRLHAVHRARPGESALVLVATVGMALVSFGSAADSPATLLEMPFAVFPVLVWAAVRCHPRVINTGLLLTVFISLGCTIAGRGPFHGSGVESQWVIYSTQVFLVVTTITMHALAIATFDQRQLRSELQSERSRYRAFIANSSEAIFRVEIDPPIDLSQDRAEVAKQLSERALLAECNRAYTQPLTDAPEQLPAVRPWRRDAFWFDLMLENLDDAIASDFTLIGTGVEARCPDGDTAHLLVSLRGVLGDGEIQRLWGTATDVTKLYEAQAQLAEQRAQLRRVTSEWIIVEDEARRRMARDLESGIGDDLDQLADAQRRLLESLPAGKERDLVVQLGEGLARAKDRCDTIHDGLDPVELARDGLAAALRRLVQARGSSERLHVDLRAGDWTDRLPMALRVLVYRVARELILDAEEEAGVHSVKLFIDRPGHSLRIRFRARESLHWPQACRPAEPGAEPSSRRADRCLGGAHDDGR